MPKKIIKAMKKGYRNSGLSQEEIDHRVYGKLNKEGLMHGAKVTGKGMRAEAKYKRDHKG